MSALFAGKSKASALQEGADYSTGIRAKSKA